MRIHIKELETYADSWGSEDEEDGDINEFHEKTSSINGNDEETIGMDKRKSIKTPHHAV